jgi:hypothetical protein
MCNRLVSNGVLGSDFATEYGLIIDFKDKCASYMRDNETIRVHLAREKRHMFRRWNGMDRFS